MKMRRRIKREVCDMKTSEEEENIQLAKSNKISAL